MNKHRSRLAAAALAGLLEVSSAYGAEPLLSRLLQTPTRRLECVMSRSLQLCVGASAPATARRLAVARQDEARYNRLQRLAGAIADRMEAGSIGGVRVKLKIILE